MVDIRLFDPARDAQRVADFYNEEGYGPIASGRAATARIILDVLAERAVKLFVVAEQRGRIVGTLGYARMSGRRVAPDGQLFAVMFLVAPSLRAGFLVGRLFSDSFERFTTLGARSLRVEVDPTNRRALPLYVRIGFRLVGDGRPDEEGYLELVSHLPGVAAALHGERSSVAGGLPYDARTIREARRQTMTTGVGRDRTGAPTISYDLEIDGVPVRAVAHADTGEILSATVDGADIDRRADAMGERVRDVRSEAVRPLADGFLIAVQTGDGTIRIEHPIHLGPLAVDPFPVRGETPAGVRRPAVRAVTTSITDTRWVSTDGEITRTVEFGRGSVSVRVVNGVGDGVTIFPWSGFRAASLTVSSASAELGRSGRYIRGVWPRDHADFEAAADDTIEAESAQAVWADLTTGLELSVAVSSPGQWRIEGPHLARVSADGSLHYRYVPCNRRSADLGTRTGGGIPRPYESMNQIEDEPISDGSRVVLGATDRYSVDVDPREGIVSWRVGDVDVITSAASHGGMASIGVRRVAIWFALQPDRFDPDAGAVSASPDARLMYRRGVDGWSVEPLPDSRLILRANARGARLAANEVVAYLTITAVQAELWDPSEGWLPDETAGCRWRAWTSRLRVRTSNGVIEIDPLSGRFPEILVRRESTGITVAMFARADVAGEAVAWQMRFVP